MEFNRERDYYEAVSEYGRRWRIYSVRGGWRMEFRDPQDGEFTYSGTFGRLRAAQEEASRPTTRAVGGTTALEGSAQPSSSYSRSRACSTPV